MGLFGPMQVNAEMMFFQEVAKPSPHLTRVHDPGPGHRHPTLDQNVATNALLAVLETITLCATISRYI